MIDNKAIDWLKENVKGARDIDYQVVFQDISNTELKEVLKKFQKTLSSENLTISIEEIIIELTDLCRNKDGKITNLEKYAHLNSFKSYGDMENYLNKYLKEQLRGEKYEK